MNNRFSQLLAAKKIAISDGAMGTMLQDAGLERGSCGERWNLERPDTVMEIQRRYVDAGSDMIITNTFGGSPSKLASYDLAEKTEAVNAAGAEIARKAAENRALVLGDIGPSGAILEPYGTMKFEDLKAQFGRQVQGLLSGGVDAFIVETMMDINEVRCAVEAIQDQTDLPIITSMCFKNAGGRYRTMFGITAVDAVKAMETMGAATAAANCMVGMEEYIPLVQQMREGTSLPIMAQPNAGQPQLQGEKAVYLETPEKMTAWVPQLVEAGAKIIGGCCGTTPEFIRLLRRWADNYNKS